MARKVGFSSPRGGGHKKSVADRYVDKFRARARRAAKQKRSVKTKRQWFAIIFIFFWLIGWSGGLILVGTTLFTGQSDWFVWIWFFFASLGWLLAVFALIRLLRGTPVAPKEGA